MRLIDGFKHRLAVLLVDRRPLLRESGGSMVQRFPPAQVSSLRMHRLEQVCLQRHPSLRGRYLIRAMAISDEGVSVPWRWQSHAWARP